MWIQPVEEHTRSSPAFADDHVAEDTKRVTDDKNIKLNLKFQVTDVKKPLIAVKRICEKMNIVNFGPGENDNFIQNINTGNKIKLHKRGIGSYVMVVKFAGGKQTEVTVDSGAEESVCPKEWGDDFEIVPAERQLNLRNASGGKINHYGCRVVQVTSPF